ncbi:hypothetical protein BKA70DRAFT_1290000, partial [Coprinopsis sp. MPI-PUGE-AT-0042]
MSKHDLFSNSFNYKPTVSNDDEVETIRKAYLQSNAKPRRRRTVEVEVYPQNVPRADPAVRQELTEEYPSSPWLAQPAGPTSLSPYYDRNLVLGKQGNCFLWAFITVAMHSDEPSIGHTQASVEPPIPQPTGNSSQKHRWKSATEEPVRQDPFDPFQKSELDLRYRQRFEQPVPWSDPIQSGSPPWSYQGPQRGSSSYPKQRPPASWNGFSSSPGYSVPPQMPREGQFQQWSYGPPQPMYGSPYGQPTMTPQQMPYVGPSNPATPFANHRRPQWDAHECCSVVWGSWSAANDAYAKYGFYAVPRRNEPSPQSQQPIRL